MKLAFAFILSAFAVTSLASANCGNCPTDKSQASGSCCAAEAKASSGEKACCAAEAKPAMTSKSCCATEGGASAGASCSIDGKTGSDGLLTNYLSAQEALANDDLAGAKAAAKQLLAATNAGACPIEDKEACAVIKEGAAAIASAGSIKAARSAFNGLSNALIAQVEKKGSASSKVYLMSCPMANDHKGGQWLQASTDLRNPYFGASMLKCGMMKASIRAESLAGCSMETAGAAGACASCAAEKS